MLYELLSGTLPFSEEGGGLAIVYRHVYELPTPLHQVAPQVPEALADVVMRALSREPSERFASAEELGVAIGRAAGSAYGAGWFEGAGVPVLGGGASLASTQPLPGQAPPPPPTRQTVAVRATRPTHVQGSADEVTAESVVPVRQVLANPPRPVGWAAATAVLVGLTAVLALSPPSTELPRRGAVLVNGVDAADRPVVDLGQPFTLQSGAPRGQATVSLSVAGVPLVGTSTTVSAPGRFRVDARGSRYLAAGTVLARITRAGSPTTVKVPLRVKRAPFTSVPGIAALVALLVVLAYAESQLAPLRRRGRRRSASLVGLAVAGGALGALGAVFTWLLGTELLTGAGLARPAVVGAAAGVLLGVTTYKAGRRSRLRRIARKQGLTPR
jgi:serine/threonine-protein kinase